MINKEVKDEIQNVLEETIIDKQIKIYKETESGEEFLKLAKILSDNNILTCGRLNFLDEDLRKELLETGHLNPNIINDKDKVQMDNLIVKNGDNLWFPIFTNKSHIEDNVLEDFNTIISSDFKKAFQDFMDIDLDLVGIVINPYTDHICIKTELCYYIATGCKDEVLEAILKYLEMQKN